MRLLPGFVLEGHIHRRETTQENFVKSINGIGKRSFYSKLLLAV
jgi:hypothetical protein